MAHIHELIDYTAAALMVHEDRILLIYHKKMNMWLPPGGHIELNEDPEEALIREIEEETGLVEGQFDILGNNPNLIDEFTKCLPQPAFMDIHQINETHRHIGLMWFVKCHTNKVRLEVGAHDNITWFNKDELRTLNPPLRRAILYYCETALEKFVDRCPRCKNNLNGQYSCPCGYGCGNGQS